MNEEIKAYINQLKETDQEICCLLADNIHQQLTEAKGKIWHAHPVWFLNGNPIVGFSKEKKGIKLLFWSGADFNEEKLVAREGKFKDAAIYLNNVAEVDPTDLKRWLVKSREIQWDYKNIVKRKGQLIKLP